MHFDRRLHVKKATTSLFKDEYAKNAFKFRDTVGR